MKTVVVVMIDHANELDQLYFRSLRTMMEEKGLRVSCIEPALLSDFVCTNSIVVILDHTIAGSLLPRITSPVIVLAEDSTTRERYEQLGCRTCDPAFLGTAIVQALEEQDQQSRLHIVA